MTPWIVQATPKITKVLDIDVEDEAGPWSRPDGQGFANDVVKAAYQAVGIQVKLHVLPYPRCKAEVISGKSVACLSMSWQPELKGKVVFSQKPLFTCQADYYYNLAKPLAARAESEIASSSTVGVVIGYEYPAGVEALKKRGVVLDESGSEQANLQKLGLGRVDYAIINHNDVKSAAKMIDAARVGDKVAFAFNSGVLESFVGFSQANPEGNWARKMFDRGHEIVIKNGTKHALEIQWMSQWKVSAR